MRTILRAGAAGAALLVAITLVRAQQPLTSVAADVNKKMVKLYGAGGFKSLPSYGTGILVSPNGWILTVNNHILTTTDLRVHTYDGRVFIGKVVVKEPELDVALIKIEEKVDRLPYFNVSEAASKPLAQPGDWILAFSNQFNIATRDEPMSVQRGVIAAHTELRGRRGVYEAPFSGEVYFIDTIACNPGAAGGIITNRKGELLGILGRELKNTLSDTWINYAVPVQAVVEVVIEDKDKQTTGKISIAKFVKEGMDGSYKVASARARDKEKYGGFTGIVLVPNAVTLTPPYVEEVMPGSPAAKAGLRPDDLIVYIDGELIPSIQQYRKIMNYIRPGTEVVLEVQRGTRLQTVKLKVEQPPKGQ